ncbi:MAG TPA: tetratricopeptide repeat protein [Balneolales bacterium]|nr:tetratricopeptide repeat protein [Balneolales bacterium]
MLRKEYIIIAVVLILAFVGISINKYSESKGIGKSSAAKVIHNSSQIFWKHYNRATKFRLRGKADSAIAAYKRALQLNSKHKDALYYVGTMYKKVDQFNNAQKVWEKLIRINPQSERAYNQLGDLLFCVQHKKFFRPDKSKWYFMRANDLNKEALNPKIRLGEIAVYQDRNDDAKGILNDLLMTQHKNAEIYFLLGYLNWKSHNNPQAAKDLEHTFEHASELHLMTDENGGKAISAKNVATGKSKGCDLFMNWLTKNLMTFRKFDVRVAMPKIYQAFNQYLLTTHTTMKQM